MFCYIQPNSKREHFEVRKLYCGKAQLILLADVICNEIEQLVGCKKCNPISDSHLQKCITIYRLCPYILAKIWIKLLKIKKKYDSGIFSLWFHNLVYLHLSTGMQIQKMIPIGTLFSTNLLTFEGQFLVCTKWDRNATKYCKYKSYRIYITLYSLKQMGSHFIAFKSLTCTCWFFLALHILHVIFSLFYLYQLYGFFPFIFD